MSFYKSQLSLPLSVRQTYDRENFFVSDANKEAVAWIDAANRWPEPFLLLCGEEGCGKTYLAHIFSKNVFQAKDIDLYDIPTLPKKFALEDIDDNVDETILFHLFNYAKHNQRVILFTAHALPLFQKPDLKSRFATVPRVLIHSPDDLLMMSLLCKGFTERQILVESDVVSYLLLRLERSFSAIRDFLERADIMSLEQKRPLTIPMVRQVLDEVKKQRLL